MLCIRGTSHRPVSVCVCLSEVGVLLKRLNVGSQKQHLSRVMSDAVVQQGSEHFVTVCDNIFVWNSVFRTHKYEDEVQIQTCRRKWHACMFIQHYAKNWQSLQSEASTSITLTLFAFHSIHCNLYIVDDVGLFVKSSVLKNFSILQ